MNWKQKLKLQTGIAEPHGLYEIKWLEFYVALDIYIYIYYFFIIINFSLLVLFIISVFILLCLLYYSAVKSSDRMLKLITAYNDNCFIKREIYVKQILTCYHSIVGSNKIRKLSMATFTDIIWLLSMAITKSVLHYDWYRYILLLLAVVSLSLLTMPRFLSTPTDFNRHFIKIKQRLLHFLNIDSVDRALVSQCLLHKLLNSIFIATLWQHPWQNFQNQLNLNRMCGFR